MKRFAKTLAAGATIVAVLALLAAATYIKYVAFLLWPGFLLVNRIYSLLGFQGIALTDYGWVFWPALAINVVLYALLYVLFRAVLTS